MSKFFDGLLESVQQMDEIVKGARSPSRETTIDDAQVKGDSAQDRLIAGQVRQAD